VVIGVKIMSLIETLLILILLVLVLLWIESGKVLTILERLEKLKRGEK